MAISTLMLRRNMAARNARRQIAVFLSLVIDMAPGLANAVSAWLAVEGLFLGGAT
jgi:hypothetical protein